MTRIARRSEGKATIYTIAGILVLVLAAVLASGLFWRSHASLPSASGPLEPVSIATNTEYAGTCPITAALDKGYFANEGILATVLPKSSGKASMEAVLHGTANLGSVADIPIMFAGLNDLPISVIASIFKTERDHGIVGRKDRGVMTLANLKGKHVGVTQNTSGHFALDALLNRQKLSPADVTIRNYKPEELPVALAQGEVDAIATWEPFLETALTKLGNNGVAFYGQDVYASLYSVAGTRDYVSTHPETVKKVLRAITRGAQFCRDEPDAARAFVATVIKIGAPKLKTSWPAYQFKIVLDQGLLLALEDEAQWAIKNKLTNRTSIPNYLNYIYLDGLEAVMPSAVTIIH